MTASSTNVSTSVYTPTVSRQMTFYGLITMLCRLPQDAVLFGSTYSNHPADTLCLRPQLTELTTGYVAGDVAFHTTVSREVVTVGEFLEFLLENRGKTVKGDDRETLVTNDCYVWVSVDSDNFGGVTGIRMNQDGSYMICTEHPYL